VVTELAAQLAYNLWSLITRLMGLNPDHHTEAMKSRRSFLFMAAQVVESGLQRTLKQVVKAEWWQQLRRSWNPKATFCTCSPDKPPMIPLNGSLKPCHCRPTEL
jgi:hypothetical protein